jgi:phospholipase D1/2
MLGGGDIRQVPWDGNPDQEIEAFVSEELYVHSKVLGLPNTDPAK